MKLPNIKILDESNKILHEKSEDVVFPLDSKTKKLIDDSLTYLEMSQIEEYSEKWGYNFKAFEIDAIDFEIWNNNSKSVIAGGTTPLAVTISTNKNKSSFVISFERQCLRRILILSFDPIISWFITNS